MAKQQRAQGKEKRRVTPRARRAPVEKVTEKALEIVGTSGAADHNSVTALKTAATLDSVPPFRPRPVHFRLLDAYESALQERTNPTDAVIAKKLGVKRETVTRWRRRNRQLWLWVYEHIGEGAVEMKPRVDRMVAELANSGSPDHIKLYYQFVVKMAVPDVPPETQQPFVIQNFLIPRPEMPQGQPVGVPTNWGDGSLPPASSIPTVLVR